MSIHNLDSLTHTDAMPSDDALEGGTQGARVDSEASSKPWFFVALIAFATVYYVATKMPM